VAQDIEKGATWVSHLYGDVESKLKVIAKDEPQVVSALSELLETGEAFLAAAAPAISDKGLSLPADSAAYAALKMFLASFESAATTFKQLIAAAK